MKPMNKLILSVVVALASITASQASLGDLEDREACKMYSDIATDIMTAKQYNISETEKSTRTREAFTELKEALDQSNPMYEDQLGSLETMEQVSYNMIEEGYKVRVYRDIEDKEAIIKDFSKDILVSCIEHL